MGFLFVPPPAGGGGGGSSTFLGLTDVDVVARVDRSVAYWDSTKSKVVLDSAETLPLLVDGGNF